MLDYLLNRQMITQDHAKLMQNNFNKEDERVMQARPQTFNSIFTAGLPIRKLTPSKQHSTYFGS